MTSTSDPRDPKPHFVTGYPAASSAATAYPYPAPPPPPPHAATYYTGFNTYTPNPNPNPNPNGYYPNPNPNGYNPNPYRRNLLLRRFLAVAVAVFLIVGAVTFIIWLVLRPKLPEFSVSSLSVSSFNLSSSNSLSAGFDLRLSVRNPNSKMSAAYDQVTAGVLYDGDPIAETSMPPFYQGTGNVTEIRASLVAAGEYVGEDVVNGIRSERGSGDGVVRFGVRVFLIVRFKAGAWRTRRHVLRVICEGIGVGFKNSSAAGVRSMVGPAKQCLVGL